MGIEVATAASGPGVIIDLMGFELVGAAGSLEGINGTTNGTRNIAIHHGTVRSGGGGGISLGNAQNNLLADLRVDSNGGSGILAGSRATVTR